MALTYDQISSITEKYFVKKLQDNIFDMNPLYNHLKKKSLEKLDGGERIMVPLQYAKLTATGFYAPSDTLSTSDNETFTAAEYLWKQAYVNITIRKIDELKNSGGAQMVNLVKAKSMAAEKTLGDTMSTALYNAGTDSNSFGGLRLIFSASNTVGGIAQGSNSWWVPQNDTSTTTLTLASMQSRWSACTIENDSPDFISTTRTIYDIYWGLLQPQQRFMSEEKAKAGFTSLMFNSTPVVADSYCPANHMMFLNTKYIHVFAHKDEYFAFEPFQKPVNQNLRTAKIYFTGNIGYSNNRMQGVMTALTA